MVPRSLSPPPPPPPPGVIRGTVGRSPTEGCPPASSLGSRLLRRRIVEQWQGDRAAILWFPPSTDNQARRRSSLESFEVEDSPCSVSGVPACCLRRIPSGLRGIVARGGAEAFGEPQGGSDLPARNQASLARIERAARLVGFPCHQGEWARVSWRVGGCRARDLREPVPSWLGPCLVFRTPPGGSPLPPPPSAGLV